MTSCGFKNNETKIIERPDNDPAFKLGAVVNDTIQYSRDSFSYWGDEAFDKQKRKEWQQKLDKEGIPIAKKGENDTDSLLVSVDEIGGKLQNPVYEFNPKTEIKFEEIVDGHYIERKGKTRKVNKFDKSSFGMESVEDVYKRVSHTVTIADKDLAKTLKKGDKIDGHVVTEDGKSPMETIEMEIPIGNKYTFNYKKNSHYQE